tara:strand:- start:82 stop:879 length:798 start_codon:yes stop_codon:yes gene_type:complete
MFTVHSKSRWARPCLKALSIQLLCLLFVGSSLSHAQDPEPTILKLQVLAWNNNVRDLAAQSMPEPVMLSATRGRVSSIYTVTTTSPLKLFRKDAAGVSTLVASVPFKEGLREALLLLSERDGKIGGALMPFATKDFPRNTATIFNITNFPVFAQIDGERLQIPAKSNHRVEYKYVYAEKEALTTKFAVQYEGRMKLVQNGFIPLMNEGRILFFISDKAEKTGRAGESPVSFTYAYDVLPDPSAPVRDPIEPMDLKDLLQFEGDAP